MAFFAASLLPNANLFDFRHADTPSKTRRQMVGGIVRRIHSDSIFGLRCKQFDVDSTIWCILPGSLPASKIQMERDFTIANGYRKPSASKSDAL
jgi:hypothetical protein